MPLTWLLNLAPSTIIPVYTLIAFDERVTFGFNAPGHCPVRVHMLLYLRVGSRATIVQARTQTMQQTHMNKAVTVCIDT